MALALLVCLVAFAIWGGPAGVFALGFVLARISFPVVDLRNAALVWFLVIGSLATGLAAIGTEAPLVAAAALACVILATGLLTTKYPEDATAWGMLAVWPVIVFLIAPGTGWVAIAAAFAGGAIAAGVVGYTADSAAKAPSPHKPTRWVFLVAKSTAAFIAIPIGFELFPAYPYWLALTVLIVAQEGGEATRRLAIHRSLGTMLGVVLGIFLGFIVSESTWLLSGTVVLLVFLQMLFMRASYVLFAVFLTAIVVLVPTFGGVDEIEAGWSRLASTALGGVIAVALVGLAERVDRRQLPRGVPG